MDLRKYTGVALVRDRHGNPRIDGNPQNMPQAMKDMLTDAEKKKLGLKKEKHDGHNT